MNTAVGIDIGGTNVKLILADQEGEILGRSQFPVRDNPTNEQFISRLFEKIDDLLSGESQSVISGIGVGSPGADINKGIIIKASNLPWNNLPVVKLLRDQFGVPVHLTNDANLFAIGEKIFGGAKALTDFIVVTMGTGVGAGIYCSGTLLQGRDGLAGEFGHIIAVPDGRPCNCGRKGCLERYVSATGVLITARECLENSAKSSILHQQDSFDTEAVAKAAMQGDPVAMQTFELTGALLGRSLADLVALFNPEAIFLAGGLTRAGMLLTDPTLRSFRSNLLDIYPAAPLITTCSLPEDDAGVLGAAALVWNAEMKETIDSREIQVQ